MAKKKSADRDTRWVEAKRKCRLNAETIRLAKDLGLNPRTLIKNIPAKTQPWKAPVHVWIRQMYAKRQAKAARKRTRAVKIDVGTEGAKGTDANSVLEATKHRADRDQASRHEPKRNLVPF